MATMVLRARLRALADFWHDWHDQLESSDNLEADRMKLVQRSMPPDVVNLFAESVLLDPEKKRKVKRNLKAHDAAFMAEAVAAVMSIPNGSRAYIGRSRRLSPDEIDRFRRYVLECCGILGVRPYALARLIAESDPGGGDDRWITKLLSDDALTEQRAFSLIVLLDGLRVRVDGREVELKAALHKSRTQIDSIFASGISPGRQFDSRNLLAFADCLVDLLVHSGVIEPTTRDKAKRAIVEDLKRFDKPEASRFAAFFAPRVSLFGKNA